MQFYVLSHPIYSSCNTSFERMEPIHWGEPSRCIACGQATELATWLSPYGARVYEAPDGFADIAWLDQASLLVSKRFRSAWEKAKMRGIAEFSTLERLELHVERRPKRNIAYYHVAPQLSSTAVDLERTTIEHFHSTRCNQCKTGILRKIERMVIDEKTWDGADIFHPRYLHEVIVVSDRFRQMCNDYNVPKPLFTPVEEYVWNPFDDLVPSGQVQILGVHPVAAYENVHLIHVAMTNAFEDINWSHFTQSNLGLDPSSWQVAYDERQLEHAADGRITAAFFFHYLDQSRPLITPAGPVNLLAPTPLPAELAHIQYDDPS